MAKIVFIDERSEVSAQVTALEEAGHKVLLVDPTIGKRMAMTRQALRRGCDLVILEPINYLHEELPELNRLLDGRAVLILASSTWPEVTHTTTRIKPMLPSDLVDVVHRLLHV